MIRSRLEKMLLATSAVALASLAPSFLLASASCAATDAADDTAKDDSSATIPNTNADGGLTDSAVSPEASCDAADPNCSAHVITCDQAPWCPVGTPVSSLYSLTSVWGSSRNDVWAVGSGGSIIHYDGTTWTATPTPVRNTFHAVWGSGPNDVYAVSMTDVLFHTTGFAAGAATWTKVPAAQAEQDDAFPRATLAVWGTGDGNVRIGARDRTVFDPDTGNLSTINQYTKKVADGGVAWSPVEGAGSVHGIWGSSATDVWYLADNSEKNGWQKGVTMHGTVDPDGGKAMTWTSVDSQSTVVLEGIWGSGSNDIWAVGDMGVIRHMTAGALRWAIVPSPTTEALHAVWGSAANDVWAVGDYGTILHFDGTAWKPSTAALPLGKKQHLYGVWGSSANDVWIVGDGITLHYTGPKAGQTGAQ
jgi:hypothetical protein